MLPHLKQEGGAYFVTFRLAGTLPKEVLLELKHEREVIVAKALMQKRPLTWQEQEEVFRWYSSRVDAYLDTGHGDCWLREPKVAALVAGALQFFHGQRYELHAWVVMPNHVHVVVWPMRGHILSDVLHSWKSYTAHEVGGLLPHPVHPFWQSESYDHLIRDDEDLHRCCQYTVTNPVTARLCARPEDWPWSSAHVAQPSSAAGSGGVSPPVRQTPGGTPGQPAGGDACATGITQ